MEKKRRSGLQIMGQLIKLLDELLPIMLLAIVLGVLGYLCAISLTILAGKGLLAAMGIGEAPFGGFSVFFVALVLIAVARGILHYGEQYCNHFIAFKLLAIIRHKVFAALRKLCPAKLDGKDKGNLIAVLTSDIELLEVFYAHTVSPIAIGVITSVIMVIFQGRMSLFAGCFAAIAYLTVGLLVPLRNGKRGAEAGMQFRDGFGELNSYVLDSLRGLDETIQYQGGEDRKAGIEKKSTDLGQVQEKLNHLAANQRALTDTLILIFSTGMLFGMVLEYLQGNVTFDTCLISSIAMMGSFGPVVALANLSNNLNQTLASGERVLSILEETPLVDEVEDGIDVEFEAAELSHVDFAYEDELILEDFSYQIKKGRILGVMGPSGSGKSTFLKLLMRFYDPKAGRITISERDVKELNTRNLRDTESYMTQDTYLFHESIESNVALAKPGASHEEVVAACKKASIHDFIESLPHGYETKVGELGDTLSGGEKQRIGLARAFLHDAPLILLDEPTSNLDSLNEGIILKSLVEEADEKTVVLVSHRKSTMGICKEENLCRL